MFDPDALDAAFEELDARYDAGEAAPYSRAREARGRLGRAVRARDWEAAAAAFAPEFVSEDHRPVGVLTFRSGAEYAASKAASSPGRCCAPITCSPSKNTAPSASLTEHEEPERPTR
jgi:hypothetical protein